MKLNPCKKCGGTKITPFWVPNTDSVLYGCSSCNQCTNGHPTKEQAIENWNDENPLPEVPKTPAYDIENSGLKEANEQ